MSAIDAGRERLLMRDRTSQYVRPLVRDVLRNWLGRKWSLQGFGMLRTYVSKELRLHVWDSRFAVPNVTTVHDHPWNFDSWIVSGRIVNTRYRVHRCTQTQEQVETGRLRAPFVKARIVCGPGGSDANAPSKLKAGGERVWLVPLEPEVYGPGDNYWQRAEEVHHTSYLDGSVTLVHRQFLEDTEHAHVYFRADQEWVSAEPRDATPDEVSQIVDLALQRFD